MRETRSSGSMEGVMSDRDPYSDCKSGIGQHDRCHAYPMSSDRFECESLQRRIDYCKRVPFAHVVHVSYS